MKLVFTKNDENEISVLSESTEGRIKFNYVEMIKNLITSKKLDEPTIEGDFSEAEKSSISSMVAHINNEVEDFYREDDEEAE